MKYRGRGENDQEINGPVRRGKGGSHEGIKEEKENKRNEEFVNQKRRQAN